jgi:hypothetical protein
MRNYKQLVYGRFCIIFCIVLTLKLILHNPFYGHPWTISKKFRLIFKPNYLTSFLIITTHQYDMKRQTNMCLFISMIIILIQIKFDIDINNDELLKTI